MDSLAISPTSRRTSRPGSRRSSSRTRRTRTWTTTTTTTDFHERYIFIAIIFLKDRRQRVVLGDAMPSWLDVISGVPQCSVLGPLLFIGFINDLPRSVKDCMCRLFADDTQLLSAIRNALAMLLVQKDIDTIVSVLCTCDKFGNYVRYVNTKFL